MDFDYEGALAEGYTEQEIADFLKSEKPKTEKIENLKVAHPDFDIEGALKEGYDLEEIEGFLAKQKPQRTNLERAGRTAAQAALGLAEATPAGMTYDLAVAPLAQKEAQTIAYRQQLFENIEDLQQKKQLSPSEWTVQEEAQLKNLVEQAKNSELSQEFIQTADVSLKGLAESVTGMDLNPETLLEKTARFAGWVKKPTNIAEMRKLGVSSKDIAKAFAPTGTEMSRAFGGALGLQMAEEGDFGPIGTLAAVVVGDAIGGGAAKAAQGLKNLVTKPKETIAKGLSRLIPKKKLQQQQEIIDDFRKAGIQADVGTLTDSNIVKWTQARLAQSGLTGEALDKFRQQLTGQIVKEYTAIADTLGTLKNYSEYELGSILKDSMIKIREQDAQVARDIYKRATDSLVKDPTPFAQTDKLAEKILQLEKELTPGQVKSTQQQQVLDAIKKLKRDIYDSERNLLQINIKDAMNNKLGLQDIVDYETQGGAKQLLKGLIKELDRTIISYGQKNKEFGKNYILGNKYFSQHAKTFRNKNVGKLLNTYDPSQMLKKMDTVQGIKDLETILNKTAEGKKVLSDVKRYKMENMVGKNLVSSVTQQAQLGTFANILNKKNNREIMKNLLSKQDYKRFIDLQKNAGRLADAAEKFYNTSKSGTVATDAAIIVKGMNDIAQIFMGNPWPLLKMGASLTAANRASKLIADPEFLKLLEDVILASKSKNPQKLLNSVGQLRPYIYALQGINPQEQNQQQMPIMQ